VKKIPAEQRDTLGLDLQGGIHLILEVEEDKAVENLTERTAGYMKSLWRRRNCPCSPSSDRAPPRL